MSKFTKIGVFLRDCPADDAALACAAHFAQMNAREASLHCIHIGSDRPGETGPDATEFESRVRAALPAAVADRTTCDVQTSSGLAEVLKSAHDADFDLVVMGRYLPSSQMGLGTGMTRLVRKCPCSVFVVPGQWRPHFSRILVAVDGSLHSELAVLAATVLARNSGADDAQLVLQTVRHVDPRHDLAGVSFEESADAQRRYGEETLEKISAKVDTKGLQVEFVVSLSDSPARAIAEMAMVRKMDVVVIGSRGPTRATAAILGSTSEGVLADCAAPVLIVKEKGETLSLLKALLSFD